MEIEPLQMTPVRQVRMSAQSHLGEETPEEEVKSFGDYLKTALAETNSLQKKSEALNAALAADAVDDISEVVVAGQKAELAMQLTLTVRNKAVSALQELMRMQV